MKKILRRHQTLIEDGDKASKLPLINENEFRNKLNDLLVKLDVQNRYTHRLSHNNVGDGKDRSVILRRYSS